MIEKCANFFGGDNRGDCTASSSRAVIADVVFAVPAIASRGSGFDARRGSRSYDLEHPEDRDISITTGLVDTSSIPALIRLVRAGKLDPSRLISHRFALDHIDAAYETFRNAADTMAIKVVVEP